MTVDVDGVEVTCRAQTGNLDPVACAEWAEFIIRANPDAARIVFTRPSGSGPCDADVFGASGEIIGSDPSLPCRPLNPEPTGARGDAAGRASKKSLTSAVPLHARL